MFKFIGGVVMCGFALYGLVKYLERPMLKVVINPEVVKKPERAAGEDAAEEAVLSSGPVAGPETPDGAAVATAG